MTSKHSNICPSVPSHSTLYRKIGPEEEAKKLLPTGIAPGEGRKGGEKVMGRVRERKDGEREGESNGGREGMKNGRKERGRREGGREGGEGKRREVMNEAWQREGEKGVMCTLRQELHVYIREREHYTYTHCLRGSPADCTLQWRLPHPNHYHRWLPTSH